MGLCSTLPYTLHPAPLIHRSNGFIVYPPARVWIRRVTGKVTWSQTKSTVLQFWILEHLAICSHPEMLSIMHSWNTAALLCTVMWQYFRGKHSLVEFVSTVKWNALMLAAVKCSKAEQCSSIGPSWPVLTLRTEGRWNVVWKYVCYTGRQQLQIV